MQILTQNQISILEKTTYSTIWRNRILGLGKILMKLIQTYFPQIIILLASLLLSFLSSWILLTLHYFNSTSLIVGRIFFYQLSRIEVIFLNMFFIKKNLVKMSFPCLKNPNWTIISILIWLHKFQTLHKKLNFKSCLSNFKAPNKNLKKSFTH
jgi:hypothetical protein